MRQKKSSYTYIRHLCGQILCTCLKHIEIGIAPGGRIGGMKDQIMRLLEQVLDPSGLTWISPFRKTRESWF